MTWLQTFCDSLVESSLQASVQLVNNNKRRKAEVDAQAQLVAEGSGGGSGDAASAGEAGSFEASEGADKGGGGSGSGEAGGSAAAGAPTATPGGKNAGRFFSLTPGRGTPFGQGGSNLLNDLMHFDVDELLKIVGSQAAAAGGSNGTPVHFDVDELLKIVGTQAGSGCAAILASPRGRQLVGLSPKGASGSAGERASQQAAAAGVPHLNQLCHKLLFSPRTAQQLAPPAPLPQDENAKAKNSNGGSSGHPAATPRQQRSLGLGLLSAARGLTPRCAMTPITPGSGRISADDLLGFLNLDALMTPANGAPGSARGTDCSLQTLRTLNMSPFPMAPMPTPSKPDKSELADKLACSELAEFEPSKMDISPGMLAPAATAAKHCLDVPSANVLSCPPPAQLRAEAAEVQLIGVDARSSLLCDEKEL